MAMGALLSRRAGMAPQALLPPRLVLVVARWVACSIPGTSGCLLSPKGFCTKLVPQPRYNHCSEQGPLQQPLLPWEPHRGGPELPVAMSPSPSRSPAGAGPCWQGPGWQGASPSCGGDTGNFDQAFCLVSSIKGEALAGWAG